MKVLETERLILTEADLSDAAFLLKLLNDESFIENIGDKGIKTLAQAQAHINEKWIDSYQTHGFGMYLAKLKSTGEFIGTCGLVKREYLDHPDVGYAFLPEHSGKGYATESAKAVIAYGKSTLGIEQIVAITSEKNIASIKVLEKLGLKFEKMVPYNETEESMLFIAK
ncbi:MAG: ribosomal-protein-alanine N-acetyltransferase [Alteromonadaceae bacterium]|jgi:ribosomal-protein-alanine N-acetyltransferase